MKKPRRRQRGKAEGDAIRKAYQFSGNAQGVAASRFTEASPGRLARECAKMDPKFEQALADEGLSARQNERTQGKILDYEDLRCLREAKRVEGKAPTVSLEEVRRRIGRRRGRPKQRRGERKQGARGWPSIPGTGGINQNGMKISGGGDLERTQRTQRT